MPPTDLLRAAVADLSARSGLPFTISEQPVTGTQLFVVYTDKFEFPQRYTVDLGTLGFRAPYNFPDAPPEDVFFVLPASIRLKEKDEKRSQDTLHRANEDVNFLRGAIDPAPAALVFSWHLFDRTRYDRRRFTLYDYYRHCERRFEQPEHD